MKDKNETVSDILIDEKLKVISVCIPSCKGEKRI